MIDWAQVGELRNEVGADDFEEVVHLFLAEVEAVIALLQSRVESGLQADAGDPLEAQLHFLRGSALSLGFTTFCSLCLTAERKAADGLATAEDVSEVLFAYYSAKAEFLEGLPNALAA